jgi:hypothetical protein
MAERSLCEPRKDQSPQALGPGQHRIAARLGNGREIGEFIAKRNNNPSKAFVDSQTDCRNQTPIATLSKSWPRKLSTQKGVRPGLPAFRSNPPNIFFITDRCNQAPIACITVLTNSGFIGITLHTPIGALIDTTHFKRGRLIIGGTCALAISAVAISWAPTLPIYVRHPDGCGGGNFRAPTVAAITLGTTSFA